MAGAGRGGKTVPLGDQEPISCDAQRGVMVEPAPVAAFKVSQPQLLFQLLVIPFDDHEALNETDNLLPLGELHPATYRTLLGLLAVTGLRISEALHLKPEDVDLSRGVLTVRQTKFRKSRLLPLHHTTVAALAHYADARQQKLIGQPVETFFVSSRGKRLASNVVHWTFRRLRESLRLVARGGHAAPRIHDLRHTFICHVLLRSYRQNQSLDRIVDTLSTYVGHGKVSDTYWYITGIPELMAVAAERFERFANGDQR